MITRANHECEVNGEVTSKSRKAIPVVTSIRLLDLDMPMEKILYIRMCQSHLLTYSAHFRYHRLAVNSERFSFMVKIKAWNSKIFHTHFLVNIFFPTSVRDASLKSLYGHCSSDMTVLNSHIIMFNRSTKMIIRRLLRVGACVT